MLQEVLQISFCYQSTGFCVERHWLRINLCTSAALPRWDPCNTPQVGYGFLRGNIFFNTRRWRTWKQSPWFSKVFTITANFNMIFFSKDFTQLNCMLFTCGVCINILAFKIEWNVFLYVHIYKVSVTVLPPTFTFNTEVQRYFS